MDEHEKRKLFYTLGGCGFDEDEAYHLATCHAKEIDKLITAAREQGKREGAQEERKRCLSIITKQWSAFTHGKYTEDEMVAAIRKVIKYLPTTQHGDGQKECTHIWSNAVMASCPPKRKCVLCGHVESFGSGPMLSDDELRKQHNEAQQGEITCCVCGGLFTRDERHTCTCHKQGEQS